MKKSTFEFLQAKIDKLVESANFPIQKDHNDIESEKSYYGQISCQKVYEAQVRNHINHIFRQTKEIDSGVEIDLEELGSVKNSSSKQVMFQIRASRKG